MKQCNCCKQVLDESRFSSCKTNKDGLSRKCKDCYAKYYKQNKEKMKKQARDNYYKNIDRYHNYDNQRRKEEHRQEWVKQWYKNNSNKLKEYQKRRNEARKQNYTKQMSLDSCVMGYLTRSIKTNFDSKVGSICVKSLPFTIQQFKTYFESQFTPEMFWDNYGTYWEIDHIVTKKLFVFNSYEDEQFKICWSLANLRPLEKSLNRQRPKDGSDISKEQAIRILGQELYNDIMGVENREESENV